MTYLTDWDLELLEKCINLYTNSLQASVRDSWDDDKIDAVKFMCKEVNLTSEKIRKMRAAFL